MNSTEQNITPKITQRQQVTLLGEDAAEMLREYHWRRAFNLFECLMKDDDHGTKSAQPSIIPYVPGARRSIVYYGNQANGSYNHHNQINKFKGLYYYAWSNGVRNEEDAGQRVLMASSPNGLVWSDPWVVLDVPEGSPWAHNCVALYTTDEAMYVVIMSEETEHDETVTGMRRIKPEDAYIDIYKSTDGKAFTKAASLEKEIKWIFEAPRFTKNGELMCICATKTQGSGALIWQDGDICSTPKRVNITQPDGAWFPYGESTWYQLDSGRIIVFWRDESASCRLYWNYSDDGGHSFSTPILSDIPDSMSRVYAGRLADGRYFIVNNAVPILLDRRALTLMLSDDGIHYTKVYMINDDPAVMRCTGLLKANGHQYPCCLVDGNKLLVAYDAGKEDIMCEVIDTTLL